MQGTSLDGAQRARRLLSRLHPFPRTIKYIRKTHQWPLPMMGSIHSISATRGGGPGCRTSATASFTAWEGEAQAHRKLSGGTTVRENLQKVHCPSFEGVHSELRLRATSTSSSIECVASSCAL